MANISDFISPIAGLQYFIPMIDYRGRIGMGASVAPEYTRKQTVSEVADAIGNGHVIVHVKFIDGNDMQDVTHEIVAEALALRAAEAAEMMTIDAINARWDHARDLRKHSEAM